MTIEQESPNQGNERLTPNQNQGHAFDAWFAPEANAVPGTVSAVYEVEEVVQNALHQSAIAMSWYWWIIFGFITLMCIGIILTAVLTQVYIISFSLLALIISVCTRLGYRVSSVSVTPGVLILHRFALDDIKVPISLIESATLTRACLGKKVVVKGQNISLSLNSWQPRALHAALLSEMGVSPPIDEVETCDIQMEEY